MTVTANLGEDAQFEYSPASQIVGQMKRRHDRKFGSLCDDYDPDTNETDDELVVHCESCSFVVVRLQK